jgi:hypothetical protein
MVEYLLRRGARVDPLGGPSWAKPIAWAERRGHADIVALLQDYVKTTTLPSRTLAEYEQLVEDLVRAYAGEPASLDRIVEYFRVQREVRWDRPPVEEQVRRVRRGLRQQLDQPERADEATLSLEDARTLIARSEGFASWAELERGVSA